MIQNGLASFFKGFFASDEKKKAADGQRGRHSSETKASSS